MENRLSEHLEEQLPQALVLRLDSRMAILLNMLVAIGGEVMNGNVKSATYITRHAIEFGRRHPELRQPLLDSISNLVRSVPKEILEAEGMSYYSANELRYRVDHG